MHLWILFKTSKISIWTSFLINSVDIILYFTDLHTRIQVHQVTKLALRFCLGLTRLQGVAMSRDMLRCTSRNRQLNVLFDKVRHCAWALRRLDLNSKKLSLIVSYRPIFTT